MLVPSFQYNIISIFQLLSQLNCYAFLTTGFMKLQGLSLKRPLEIGKVEHGLYIFHLPITIVSSAVFSTAGADFSITKAPYSFSISAFTNHCTLPVFPKHCNSESINENDVLWHQRMGHLPFFKMHFIPHVSVKFSPKQSFTCPMARQQRNSFPTSSTHSTSAF